MLLFRNSRVAERVVFPMLKLSNSLPSERRARLHGREIAKEYVKKGE